MSGRGLRADRSKRQPPVLISTNGVLKLWSPVVAGDLAVDRDGAVVIFLRQSSMLSEVSTVNLNLYGLANPLIGWGSRR